MGGSMLQTVCVCILPDEGTEGVDDHFDPLQSSDTFMAEEALKVKIRWRSHVPPM